MADRFRSYDVTAKRDSPSWDAKTRQVIDERMALDLPEAVLTEVQLSTLRLVVERVCPNPEGRGPTTTLAMIVHKIAADERDGNRHHRLPPTAECWRRGLDAIEDEAKARFASPFGTLEPQQADDVLRAVESGNVQAGSWKRLPARLFWQWRVIPDCVAAHWAQPALWSAMGFGGPASPRGYVRLDLNRRDPWESVEESGAPYRGLPRHRER